MDNEEEYLPLVQYTLENFDIQEDLDKWDNIQNKIRETHNNRRGKLDEMGSTLRSLSRQLELAKASMQEAQSKADTANISQELKNLDKEKFLLAKSINEIEQQNASSLTLIDQLTLELQRLENEDSSQALTQDIDDAEILKLKVYRSLGIELETASQSQVPTRALIQSSNGKIQIFNLDKNYSPSFVSNYLWERL